MNDTKHKEMYDIIVIGAGPVGLFAGYYASLRAAKVLLLEAQETFGGQVATLYPDKKIWDVAGLAGESGRQLIDGLVEQAKRFDLEMQTGARVTDLQKEADGTFTVVINDGAAKKAAKTVILATGKGAFEPRRLQVENEAALVEKGLSYVADNLANYAGQKVAVLGGGDSAVDLANELAERASQTYLIHRRETFRAMEQSVKELQASAVIKKTPYKVARVDEKGGQLTLSLVNPKDEQQKESLTVDQLIVQYGFKTAGQAERQWSIDVDWDKAGLLVSEQVKTKQEGLFAIGDLTSYPEHVDLIATGFGQAPAAVNAALALVAPEKGGPGHSSSLVIEP